MTNAGLMSMNVGQKGDPAIGRTSPPQYIPTSCCPAVPIAVAGGKISIFVQPYSGTVACGDSLHGCACCLLRVTFCFLLCAVSGACCLLHLLRACNPSIPCRSWRSLFWSCRIYSVMCEVILTGCWWAKKKVPPRLKRHFVINPLFFSNRFSIPLADLEAPAVWPSWSERNTDVLMWPTRVDKWTSSRRSMSMV